MSNNYFQFRQFRIEQDRCAMKVTTDACIQGAWTPLMPEVKRVLDIGAGTGLLSLMLAQRNGDITVEAVEFDKPAAMQAAENINASPWKDRVKVIDRDIRDHIAGSKYDLIITNPPFFNNSLLGDKKSRNTARHTLSLTYTELLKSISVNLNEDGYFSILLPNTEYIQWKELVGSSFYEVGRLSVSHTADAPVKRVVGLFARKDTIITNEQLVIKGGDNNYTRAFIDLLSPFYLDL